MASIPADRKQRSLALPPEVRMAPEINRNLTIASATPVRAAFAGDRKILSPFDKAGMHQPENGRHHCRQIGITMRGWCEEHGLGRRIGGGSWMVSRVALAMFLDGDIKALRAYHAGDRESELVTLYFRRATVGFAAMTKSAG
jgi:hypothetical protein